MYNFEEELRSYAQMGMAAMLPGMEYAIELLQQQVDEMRAQLKQLQGLTAENKKHGLTETPTKKRTSSGWSADPKERSEEMLRRRRVATQRQKREVAERKRKALTTGDKISQAQKKSWQQMTPRQRSKRLAAMAAGRNRKKSVPNGELAA